MPTRVILNFVNGLMQRSIRSIQCIAGIVQVFSKDIVSLKMLLYLGAVKSKVQTGNKIALIEVFANKSLLMHRSFLCLATIDRVFVGSIHMDRIWTCLTMVWTILIEEPRRRRRIEQFVIGLTFLVQKLLVRLQYLELFGTSSCLRPCDQWHRYGYVAYFSPCYSIYLLAQYSRVL